MLLSGYFITIINYLGLQIPLGQLPDVPAPIEGHVKPHPGAERFEPWTPPGALLDPGDPNSELLKCDYSAMVSEGYLPSRPQGNGEWIPHKSDPSKSFNISTDYDKRTPTGITREVSLFNLFSPNTLMSNR